MSKTTITYIVDDLDGSKDATEVSFTFGGVDYTIDLSKKNTAAMEKALKPYIDAATKVTRNSPKNRRTKPTGSPGPRNDLASIRDWARKHGIQVSDRGRIAASVIAQYDTAN